MKILLDEQLPVKLRHRFKHELQVSTVRDEQGLGIKNGSLILLAINAGFTVFITNDQSLTFHQKLTQFKILFININQSSNRYEDVFPVILSIEDWIIQNETRIELLLETKNYLVYPEDLN